MPPYVETITPSCENVVAMACPTCGLAAQMKTSTLPTAHARPVMMLRAVFLATMSCVFFSMNVMIASAVSTCPTACGRMTEVM